MELYHHGIKGMKWGVRRYDHRNVNGTHRDINSIIKSLNEDERDKMALDKSGKYLSKKDNKQVALRVLKKIDKMPASFFDLLKDGNELQVTLGTRSGDQYRGKGYAAECVRKGMEWFESQNEFKTAVWGVRTDNAASIRLAEKNGFQKDNASYSKDKKWVNYVYKK